MTIVTHPDFQIIKLTVSIVNDNNNITTTTNDGKNERNNNKPIEVPVKDAEKIHIVIPNGVQYQFTLYFQVKNKPYNNVRYKQVVKKHGITMRTRELEIGNYEPSPKIEKEGIKKEEEQEEEQEEEEQVVTYSKEFPIDETPSSRFSRGFYYCTSWYYVGDDKNPIITTDWTLEIVAKT